MPKYRFVDKNKKSFPEWRDVVLSDILFERKQTQTITADAPLLSFTIEEGVINPANKKTNKRDFLIKDIETKKFALTEVDDIIYNPANLKFGAIHRNKLSRGVVSPIYAIFYTNQYPPFIEYIVTNPVFIKKSLKYLEGTVVKLMTLKPKDFLKMHVRIPCYEEQVKIANFLECYDKEILAQKDKIDYLKRRKESILNSLFDKKIRFKDSDGKDFSPWKTKKLRDLFVVEKKNPVCTSDYKKITISLHKGGISFADNEKKMADTRPFYVRKKGEIIIGKQNYFNGSIAIVTEEYDNTICSNAIMSFPVKNPSLTTYLYEYISTDNYLKKREFLANGTGQKELSEKTFLDFEVEIPCEKELSKIVDFIEAIDKQIKLEIEKQDIIVRQKATFLAELFE